jgi:shikimate kinase
MKPEEVNLYLVGFMGTGKTTIGRALAQRMGFECVDTDQEIEKARGRSIPQIFATEGEAAFRRYEREMIEGGHPARRAIVVCGGGLVVQPGMAGELRRRGVVVCLHASTATILDRTSRQCNRPLLDVPNPEERIRSLFAEREPIYRSVGTLVLTDGRPVRDIVGHVHRIWKREAPVFARASGAGGPT